MDQAPRSAFLSAVVFPAERTAVMGIVNTVKTLSQSSGPTITGLLAGSGRFWIAFLVAGCLKAGYDLGMLVGFSRMKLEGDVGNSRARESGGVGGVSAPVEEMELGEREERSRYEDQDEVPFTLEDEEDSDAESVDMNKAGRH